MIVVGRTKFPSLAVSWNVPSAPLVVSPTPCTIRRTPPSGWPVRTSVVTPATISVAVAAGEVVAGGVGDAGLDPPHAAAHSRYTAATDANCRGIPPVYA
jgi:hypothetical protein